MLLDALDYMEKVYKFQSRASPYVLMSVLGKAVLCYFVPMKYLLMATGAGIFFATAPGNICFIRFFALFIAKPHKTFGPIDKGSDYFVNGEEEDPPDDWMSADYERIREKANT